MKVDAREIIDASLLKTGVEAVKELLDDAAAELATAIQAAGALNAYGVMAARTAGVPLGQIGEVLDYAGRMQADLGHAALMLQGVHASLHEALERLSPTEERSGPGDKTPPPKP